MTSFPSRRLPHAAFSAALIVVATFVAGCTTLDTYVPTWRNFGIYKLDVNQGNYVSQDMVDKLKAGQSKSQVRQLLGSPLVISAFRDSRWDYVYSFKRQGTVLEQRTFTVYFVDDKLARWEGDEMPSSVAELNKAATARTAGEEEWTDTRSWLDKILDALKK